MDKKALMENLARELNKKDGFNGAWLYAEKGEIVGKGVLGFRDPENTLPITEDTIFQLASVSKTFTSAAVMLLMRQRLLSPEDRITKFFPELIAYKDVTVRHLLTHTSGIPDYFDDADWFIKIRGSLLPLEMNACLPGCVWNATPRSLSPLERNIGFWTQA